MQLTQASEEIRTGTASGRLRRPCETRQAGSRRRRRDQVRFATVAAVVANLATTDNRGDQGTGSRSDLDVAEVHKGSFQGPLGNAVPARGMRTGLQREAEEQYWFAGVQITTLYPFWV
jgi:hypothetical protein